MAAATATPLTDEARDALEQTSTDALLTTFAALTHRIHEADRTVRAERQGGYERALRRSVERAADLRAQRDAIRVEILQRTGDA